jgi:hypothetical protein
MAFRLNKQTPIHFLLGKRVPGGRFVSQQKMSAMHDRIMQPGHSLTWRGITKDANGQFVLGQQTKITMDENYEFPCTWCSEALLGEVYPPGICEGCYDGDD